MATIRTGNWEGRRRRLHGWLAALIATGLVFFGNAMAQESAGPAEIEVKAAFVYKFAGYVEWPKSSLSADGPLTIGVAGAPEIESELHRIARGRTVGGRSIDIRSVSNENDVRGVQVLFIGGDATAATDRLIAAARQAPILLITDMVGGLDRGAMINFVMVQRRVQFEIAIEPAEKAGLGLSSRLLAVALRVKKGDIASDVLLADTQIGGERTLAFRSRPSPTQRVFFTTADKETRFVSLA